MRPKTAGSHPAEATPPHAPEASLCREPAGAMRYVESTPAWSRTSTQSPRAFMLAATRVQQLQHVRNQNTSTRPMHDTHTRLEIATVRGQHVRKRHLVEDEDTVGARVHAGHNTSATKNTSSARYTHKRPENATVRGMHVRETHLVEDEDAVGEQKISPGPLRHTVRIITPFSVHDPWRQPRGRWMVS